jgi:hypothetical protein
LYPHSNSTLSAYLKKPRFRYSKSSLSAYLKNPRFSHSDSSLSAYLKKPRFPRSNSSLSAYLKNPRLRTRASVTLAVAAATAGLSAASATASGQPWSASLNSMAQAGHGGTGSAAEAGTSLSDAMLGPASQQAAPQNGGQTSQAGNAQLTARQNSANASASQALPGSLRILRPIPAHHATNAQHPAAARKPATPVMAAHPKPAPRRPAAVQAPAKPYTIYDSVTPTEIPSSGQDVATYANGSYQASWSELRGRHDVLWIDTNGSDPGCNVLDVEPGDATPTGAAQWVQQRLTMYPNANAIVYTMLSEWQQVKDAVGTLPSQMQSHVQYWIADPTGIPHMVPGADATQWYWGPNYDMTAALPQFND